MTAMSDLYSQVRVLVGDFGVYDDSGSLVSNSYLYQNATITGAIEAAMLEVSGYSASGTTITPSFTSTADRALVVYWTAYLLLSQERDLVVKTPGSTITKQSVDRQLSQLVSGIHRHMNSGSQPYASDNDWQRLYNIGLRRLNQISGISEG